MVQNWGKWMEKYTHITDNHSFRLEYRREALVTKAQERKITHAKAVQLLASEVRASWFGR